MKRLALQIRPIRLLIPSVFLLMTTVWAAAATNPILGFWDLKIEFGERQFDAKLRIFHDEEGKLAGTWGGRMGDDVVTDVAFTGDKLTFRRTTTFEDQNFTSSFAGTLSADSLDAIVTSDWGRPR